ncbi:hypothetical protein LCGC14_0413500 [marine sediment metagenome]|uniref:Uncharacterized protein n=1 Tax=marine sediment metagenome TaxID=412755 RepID=A0A0F9W2A7_9ZZZZ
MTRFECTQCAHGFEFDGWPTECPKCDHYHCGDDTCCYGGFQMVPGKEDADAEEVRRPGAEGELS